MDIRTNPVNAGTMLHAEEARPLRSCFAEARRTLALERGLVAYFAESQASRAVLDALAARRRPVGFKTLVSEARSLHALRGRRSELPISALRAVVRILQAANLIRMERGADFAITALGRELGRRLEGETIERGDQGSTASPRMARRDAGRRRSRRQWGEALSRTLRTLKRH